MIYTILNNKGEKFDITVGGRIITVQKGENWMPRGTGEFIMTKVGGCELLSKSSKECTEDGIDIDIEKQGVKKEEDVLVVDKLVQEPEELKKVEETISESVVSVEKEKISDEDREKYLKELKAMDRKKLIEILQFKEIGFAKNSSDEKLIKLIINSVK